DRAVKLLGRLFVISKPEMRPAERIDDVAIVGTLLDRLLDHPHPLVEVDALIDPGIPEIVQNVRLVRIKLERLLEIGLGLVPLLGALVADAAEVEYGPVRALRRRNLLDRAAVGIGAIGILLALALDTTERQDRLQIVGARRDQLLKVLL